MKFDGKRVIRKCTALFVAVIVYFVIHEGAHLLYALYLGVFNEVRFLEFGIQIAVFRERMTDFQVGVMCVLGPVASLVSAYFMVGVTPALLKRKSVFLRAVTYYVTLVLLLTDPIYLSVIFPFVGGGDMNGIALLVPQTYAVVFFGCVALVNGVIFLKYLMPAYGRAYKEG